MTTVAYHNGPLNELDNIQRIAEWTTYIHQQGDESAALFFFFLASHHNILNICSPENMVRAMKLDYEYIMRWRPNKITICPLSLLWGCHVYMQSSARWKPFYAFMSRKDCVCRFPHSWLKIVGYTQHLERTGCRYERREQIKTVYV